MDDFLFYELVTVAVHVHSAKGIVLVECHMVADGPIVLKSVLAVVFNWLSSVARKMISEVERDYQLYRDVTDGNDGTPTDVSADTVHELDSMFA